MSPAISIIIPVYNGERYLSGALRSVQNQTFTDWECICIDDGSRDNSASIVQVFINQDARFRLISQENSGVSVARNAGLDVARGEYITFLDQDDVIVATAFSQMLETAGKFNADMVRGRVAKVPDNFQLPETEKDIPTSTAKFYDNPISNFPKVTRVKYRLWCWIWMCLFRKEAIHKIRFVNELKSGGEDNLFMFEAIGAIKNFVQLDQITVCHRKSATSTTRNGFNPLLVSRFLVTIPYIYKKYASNPDVDKRLLKWVYKKIAYNMYRVLVRDTVRKNQHIRMAQDILFQFQGTPEMAAITRRLSLRRRLFLRLFIHNHIKVLKALKWLMYP